MLNALRIFPGLIGFCYLLIVSVVLAPSKIEARIGGGFDVAEGQPMNIRAESLTYLPESNLFVAEGSVEITYRKSRLTADRVEFNQKTGEALAIGNVVYEEEGETLIADQATLNIDSQLGIIHSGELSLADDQYITGQEIEKTGKDTYVIRKGTYTACSSPHPAWQFRSSRAKVEQGEYLQSWHTVGYIKGIPVFYFPFFIFPIKTERQTGLLVPEVGKSSVNGFTISNAFFWAISKSQDLTLTHTYYEKRGHKIDLEYRYKYSQQTDGTLQAQYIRDQLDLIEYKRLKWNHRNELPYSIKMIVNLDLTSNDNFDQEFETSLDTRTNQKLKSDVSFTRKFSQHTIRLLFNRLDDLRTEGQDRADQRFPELQITSQRQQLFGSPLYIQQTTTVSHLQREGNESERLEFSRFDMQPTLSMPLNFLGQAVTINPEVRLRETYYTRDATTAADNNLNAQPVHREYYSIGVSVDGPKINRIFDLGTTHRTQKLKHLIEPNFSFQYAPGIDETELPKFDGIDRVGSTKDTRYISYGITQRLLAKQVPEDDWKKFLEGEEEMTEENLPTETKELASLSITQSYNFEAEEYPFSNITLTLRTQPFRNYDLVLRTSYDVYVNEFVETNVNFEGKLWDKLSFDLRWRRNISVNRETDDITAVNQFLDVSTQLTLFESIGLSYRGRFNIETKQRIEDSIGLTYNAQCWNIIGSYTQQIVNDEWDKRFQVILELKHLGKLFDIKG